MCTPCAVHWGGETPDRRPLLRLTKHELPGTASFTLVTPLLPLSFLKEQVDDAKYDYSVEYQQPPDLTGKGLCARALYDYQAGKTCGALASPLNWAGVCWARSVPRELDRRHHSSCRAIPRQGAR